MDFRVPKLKLWDSKDESSSGWYGKGWDYVTEEDEEEQEPEFPAEGLPFLEAWRIYRPRVMSQLSDQPQFLKFFQRCAALLEDTDPGLSSRAEGISPAVPPESSRLLRVILPCPNTQQRSRENGDRPISFLSSRDCRRFRGCLLWSRVL